MPLTLLSIGGNDLTQYMDIQGYAVNRVPVFEEWTDGNHIKHRNIIRNRIKGSFKIGFRSSTDVTAFLTVLSSYVTAGGYYPAQIFANDDNTLHTANIFIDGLAEIRRDIVNGREWYSYNLTVEEI